MKLFTDIDGVLLGKSPQDGSVILADHAHEYLDFCLTHFDCYWLTTHCRGQVDPVLKYLEPFADDEFMTLARRVRPTHFRVFKTEALAGDFIWVDDQPTAGEFLALEEGGNLHRWYQVNTRANRGALRTLVQELAALRARPG